MRLSDLEKQIDDARLVGWSLAGAVMSMSIPLSQGLKNVRIPLLFIYGEHDDGRH